jgi:CheY-like chemotaxis protein/anti-sigma regulatory factor (Ser/Thr protein kinase)
MDTLVPNELETPWRHAAALQGAADLASAVSRRLREIAASLPSDISARADVEAYADRLGALSGESLRLAPLSLQRWLDDQWPRWAALADAADVRLRLEPSLIESDADVDADRLRIAMNEVVGNAIRAVAALPADLVRAVTVRVEHVESDGAEIGPVPPLDSGRYLRITVADTGAGMDTATRARAPHPGDGLGLAIAYGAVRQAGGALWIDSTEGWGTRVFLFVRKTASALLGEWPVKDVVLIVEDEAHVRAVIRRLLTGQGLTVIESGNGRDAVELVERFRGRLRAVISDVVMPVMGGREVVQQLRQTDPELPVICMSGFGERDRLLEGLGDTIPWIEKPFTGEQLVTTLRAAIGSATS